MLNKLIFVISVLISLINSSLITLKANKSVELPGRLPSNVRPSYYDLKIRIDVDELNFEGNVAIDIEIIEETSFIAINYKDIKVEFENVILKKNDSDSAITFDNVEFQTEMAFIRFKNVIEVGFYTLTLSFSGNIRNDLKGLYKSIYDNSNVMATTHFEPSYARMVFPCFDEPHLKSTFKITVSHHKKFKVLSNMRKTIIVGPVLKEGDFIVTTFDITPVMSTYLVAFIVSDYDIFGEETDPFIGYAPPNKALYTNDSIQFAPKAMKALEEYLNVDYQLTLTQLVSINDFLFGAMENWGLITFRSEYLLYPNSNISPRIHQHSRLLISHEFAHMWFGNEVTPEWWTFVWLSEGFAQFFQYYTTNELEPKWRIWEQFNVNNLQSALSQDDKNDIRIMSETIEQASDTQFDYIVYAKSSSVIRMFYEIIGEEAFREALHNYIKENSFRTVVPEDLFNSFQLVIDKKNIELPTTFATLFESWSNELGYPVVFADVQVANNKIIASQKRFFVDPALMAKSVKGNYYIPITVATDTNDNSYDVNWLVPEAESIHINFEENVKFTILNKLQAGYYRVNYNEDYWSYLANFLSNEDNIMAIREENRAQLIDDAANLAKAGLVSYEILFKLLYNLKHDTGFLPWMAASNSINFLARMLLGSQQYGRFENFLRIIANKNYEIYKIDVDFEDHVERLHRINSVAWACHYGHEACVKDVRQLISTYINDVNAQFADEIRPVILCTFSRYVNINDDLAQDLLYKILGSFSSIDEVTIVQMNELITGFGCMRNETTIISLLEISIQNEMFGIKISGEIRARIAVALVNGSYEGVQIMIRYLTENFTKLLENYDIEGVISVLNALGSRIVTEELATAFSNFVTKNEQNLKNVETVYDAAMKAQIAVISNVQWRNTYGGDIEKWLQNNIDDLESDSSSILVFSKTILFIAFAGMIRQFI